MEEDETPSKKKLGATKKARPGVLARNAAGDMTKLTYPDDTKITRHDKTRDSIEGGEKIASDTEDYSTTCTAERKVDTDDTKMTLSDKTGEERKHSNASDKGEQVETWDNFNGLSKKDRTG